MLLPAIAKIYCAGNLPALGAEHVVVSQNPNPDDEDVVVTRMIEVESKF